MHLQFRITNWPMEDGAMKKSFSCLPLGRWNCGTLSITQKVQVVLTDSINWLSLFSVLLSFVSRFCFLNHFSNHLHVAGFPFQGVWAKKKGIFQLSWAFGPLALLKLLVPFIFCFLTGASQRHLEFHFSFYHFIWARYHHLSRFRMMPWRWQDNWGSYVLNCDSVMISWQSPAVGC